MGKRRSAMKFLKHAYLKYNSDLAKIMYSSFSLEFYGESDDEYSVLNYLKLTYLNIYGEVTANEITEKIEQLTTKNIENSCFWFFYFSYEKKRGNLYSARQAIKNCIFYSKSELIYYLEYWLLLISEDDFIELEYSAKNLPHDIATFVLIGSKNCNEIGLKICLFEDKIFRNLYDNFFKIYEAFTKYEGYKKNLLREILGRLFGRLFLSFYYNFKISTLPSLFYYYEKVITLFPISKDLFLSALSSANGMEAFVKSFLFNTRRFRQGSLTEIFGPNNMLEGLNVINPGFFLSVLKSSTININYFSPNDTKKFIFQEAPFKGKNIAEVWDIDPLFVLKRILKDPSFCISAEYIVPNDELIKIMSKELFYISYMCNEFKQSVVFYFGYLASSHDNDNE